MKNLYKILNIYLGNQQALEAPLSEQEWLDLYECAKKQSVLGLVQAVADMLPLEQKPPRKVKIRLALISEKIQAANQNVDSNAKALYTIMKGLGRRCCLLKGQGIAQLYPTPNLRQSGDIDMWVEGDRKSVLELVRSKWPVGEISYHHCDTRIFDDKTKVEIHFTPTWMNNPFHNKILQKYFATRANEEFSNYFLDLQYAKSTSEFNTIFCLVHLYRHVLFEGVGLRQMIDYLFVLRNSSTEDRQLARELVNKLKMTRFTAAVMYYLKEYFGLEDKYILVKPSEKYGKFLVKEIERSGNFGQYDPENKTLGEKNSFKKGFYRLTHLLTFIRISPSEVLWGPVFKIWQKCWKFSNKY